MGCSCWSPTAATAVLPTSSTSRQPHSSAILGLRFLWAVSTSHTSKSVSSFLRTHQLAAETNDSYGLLFAPALDDNLSIMLCWHLTLAFLDANSTCLLMLMRLACLYYYVLLAVSREDRRGMSVSAEGSDSPVFWCRWIAMLRAQSRSRWFNLGRTAEATSPSCCFRSVTALHCTDNSLNPILRNLSKLLLRQSKSPKIHLRADVRINWLPDAILSFIQSPKVGLQLC